MIVPLLTLVLGGGVGYLVGRKGATTDSRASKALAPAQDTIPAPVSAPREAYRPPDRAAVINLPYDAEDFEQLRAAVCEGFKDLAASGHQVTSDALRDWVLIAIYPDFQWPPVPGDPSEALMMWMIADHEARRALAAPLQCGVPARAIAGPKAGGGS